MTLPTGFSAAFPADSSADWSEFPVTGGSAPEVGKDAQIARKDERIERLEKLVAAFKQAGFGRKSDKTDADQFDLALEDLETAIAAIHAEDEADVSAGNRITKSSAFNRGSLPKHLPRVEEVIEQVSLVCACGGCLHCIGEDVSERFDVVPASLSPPPKICVPCLH